MTTRPQVLVLAESQLAALPAARWAPGDALVKIGVPTIQSEPITGAPFDSVVVSGEFADESWLVDTFDLAGRSLRAGGRVTLLVGSVALESSAPEIHDLPDAIASSWTLVAFVVEHPVTAVSFTRAADADGRSETRDSFRHAQMLSALYRHPHLLPVFESDVAETSLIGRTVSDSVEVDAEVAQLRGDLEAYRNSTLGRVTTRYWELRRRIRRQ